MTERLEPIGDVLVQQPALPMSRKAEKIILAVLLFNSALIGVIGYAREWREGPVGMLFVTSAGPVAFNHQLHAPPDATEDDCKECHHDTPAGKNTEMNCRACHYYGKEPFQMDTEEIHKRCIGAKCADCHDIGECGHCHKQ